MSQHAAWDSRSSRRIGLYRPARPPLPGERDDLLPDENATAARAAHADAPGDGSAAAETARGPIVVLTIDERAIETPERLQGAARIVNIYVQRAIRVVAVVQAGPGVQRRRARLWLGAREAMASTSSDVRGALLAAALDARQVSAAWRSAAEVTLMEALLGCYSAVVVTDARWSVARAGGTLATALAAALGAICVDFVPPGEPRAGAARRIGLPKGGRV